MQLEPSYELVEGPGILLRTRNPAVVLRWLGDCLPPADVVLNPSHAPMLVALSGKEDIGTICQPWRSV
jgi:hypothetical protein